MAALSLGMATVYVIALPFGRILPTQTLFKNRILPSPVYFHFIL